MSRCLAPRAGGGAYMAEHPDVAEEIRLALIEARKAENAVTPLPVAPSSEVAAAA